MNQPPSKPRPGDKLKTLPREVQDELMQLSEAGKSYDYIREWLAREFGLEIKSNSSLSEFRDFYLVRERYERSNSLAANITELLSKKLPQVPLEDLEKVGDAVFIAQSLHAQDAETFAMMRGVRQKDRSADIKERQVEIMERRLTLLEKQAEKAKEAITSTTLTEAEKAARMKEIFGIA